MLHGNLSRRDSPEPYRTDTEATLHRRRVKLTLHTPACGYQRGHAFVVGARPALVGVIAYRLTLSVTDSASALDRLFSSISPERMRNSAQIDTPTFPLSFRARALWRSLSRSFYQTYAQPPWLPNSLLRHL